MSTRCQIGFYQEKPKVENLDQFEALIYRHSDGYPGKADGLEYGVLADLVPFLITFHKNRGLSDAEYAGARTLQHLTNEYDKDTIESHKKMGLSSTPSCEFIGYGICRAFHGDIEYFYAVYSGGVDVYETEFDALPEKWRLIETIPIEQAGESGE